MPRLNIQQEFLIPMPLYKDYLIISTDRSANNRKVTILAPITEEIEKEIDKLNREVYTLKLGNSEFKITHNNIYCYGEVDLNDEDTCNTIDKFNFLNYLGSSGIPIYSNYDYNLHACHSDKRKAKWTETYHPIDIVKYAHGCLSKPKCIILFNYNMNDKIVQKKCKR